MKPVVCSVQPVRVMSKPAKRTHSRHPGANPWTLPASLCRPGSRTAYGFDDIGNRKATAASGSQSGAGLRPAYYAANLLNQYPSRTVPGGFDVLGAANATNAAGVNGSPTDFRHGGFRQELLTANSASAPRRQTVGGANATSGSRRWRPSCGRNSLGGPISMALQHGTERSRTRRSCRVGHAARPGAPAPPTPARRKSMKPWTDPFMPTPALKTACIAAKIVQWFGPDFNLIQNAYNAYKAYGFLQNENQRLLDAVCNKSVSNPWVVDIDIGRRPWDD
jgi:hypothetical protein